MTKFFKCPFRYRFVDLAKVMSINTSEYLDDTYSIDFTMNDGSELKWCYPDEIQAREVGDSIFAAIKK